MAVEDLVSALLSGDLNRVKSLLDEGADVNTSVNGETILTMTVKFSNIESFKLLLECNADPNIKMDHGYTALLTASTVKDVEYTKLLLEHNADINASSISPLISALLHKNIPVAKLLVAAGANTEATPGQDVSPLMLAVCIGFDLPVENINWQNSMGRTALHVACCNRKTAQVVSLLAQNADTSLTDTNGDTALHMACKLDYHEIVDVLLGAGADVNIVNRKGRSPLMSSVFENSEKNLRALICNGADLNLADDEHLSALDFAMATKQTDIADILRLHGAKSSFTSYVTSPIE